MEQRRIKEVNIFFVEEDTDQACVLLATSVSLDLTSTPRQELHPLILRITATGPVIRRHPVQDHVQPVDIVLKGQPILCPVQNIR